MNQPFYVKFWGVRGTVPTPNSMMLRYGGHTSCVEVRCGGVIFAFDAGTGIIRMGEQNFTHMHLLLSHTHIDHVLGFPLFPKLYDPAFQADIWAGHLMPDMFIHEALTQLMSPPLFPIALRDTACTLHFHDFAAGHQLNHKDFTDNGIDVYTMPLNHPDRATAYRIVCQGKSVCYVTDVEHIRDNLDIALVDFIRKSDVFIYDSTYDDRHFSDYEGWGHSTWQQAIRLGEAAQVGKVILFHHDPSASDEMLDRRKREIRESYVQEAIIAREGLVLEL